MNLLIVSFNESATYTCKTAAALMTGMHDDMTTKVMTKAPIKCLLFIH
ncbi:MAG: hypothetical protein LBT66_06360 [Methanobrevibacter sp.]|nr:hypothetical protein [Candidatus Methanovirga meridionalis]